jgi:hypothetical protein
MGDSLYLGMMGVLALYLVDAHLWVTCTGRLFFVVLALLFGWCMVEGALRSSPVGSLTTLSHSHLVGGGRAALRLGRQLCGLVPRSVVCRFDF